MKIILMGVPGSGKTTQAELLAKDLNLPHIETGAVYRSIANEPTVLGEKVKKILGTGDLIDDETTFQVVDKYINEIKGGFILDGFPRTLVQAQRELFFIDKVFYIKLTDEEATKRLLLRARAGETPEIIQERLTVYHQETEPILNYYRGQKKLMEIDGSGTIEEVHDLIKNS